MKGRRLLVKDQRSGSDRLQQRRGPHAGAAVVQVDLPGLGDGRGPVEVHQLVEGRELLRPQEVLSSTVPHHFEVLDVALVSEGGRLVKPAALKPSHVFQN